jgi:hypothetical protein
LKCLSALCGYGKRLVKKNSKIKIEEILKSYRLPSMRNSPLMFKDEQAQICYGVPAGE